MGGNTSQLSRPPPDFTYFLLYFYYSDTMKLALANDDVIQTIRLAVNKYWQKGIQSEGDCDDGSYEIKLLGNPFRAGESGYEAVQSKRFCCKFLSDLRTIGWTLTTTSDLSQSDDRSTLFFQRSSLANKPALMVCLSLSFADSLQLVNAPELLISGLRETVLTRYSLGVQEEKPHDMNYEVKLRGYPWSSEKMEEHVCGRKLLLDIFRRFDQLGFQFYGTANLKETADCVFFVYDEQHPVGVSKYAMVSLSQMDRLRLIDCPTDLVDLTRSLIDQAWKKGVQSESNLKLAWEFQLKGYPWNCDGNDSIWSRYFITAMLQKFLTMGWCLSASLDVSRKLNDKSVFVFKSCQPLSLAHFCISLNEVDKVRLVNAPQDMVDVIGQALKLGWPQGIECEGEYFGSHQFTLHGHPWGDRTGNEFLLARCMMLLVLRVLMERGWRVVCSADISAQYRHSGSRGSYTDDVHSWFVVYTGNTKSVSASVTPSIAPSAPPLQMQESYNDDGLPSYSDLHYSS